MAAPYMSLAIANRFIQLGSTQDGVEHMKLQKLVYYAYGWWLASKGLGEKRLATEGPEIWKHGPVFANLYSSLKTFGRMPIKEPQSLDPFSPPTVIDENDKEVQSLIRWIWGRYGHLSGFALSDMTHSPETSWYRTAEENNFFVPFSTKIKDKYIFEEFSKLMLSERGEAFTGGVDDVSSEYRG